MIKFPIWVLTSLDQASDPCGRYVCDHLGYVIGFDRLDFAIEHLTKNPHCRIGLHRLQHDEAVMLIADMYDSHSPGMCLDPSSHGCAKRVPIQTLVAALNN
jgi:hypothetical protein